MFIYVDVYHRDVTDVRYFFPWDFFAIMCHFLCPRSSLSLLGEISAVQMIIIIITTVILYFVKNRPGLRGITPAITVTIILLVYDLATGAEEDYVLLYIIVIIIIITIVVFS